MLMPSQRLFLIYKVLDFFKFYVFLHFLFFCLLDNHSNPFVAFSLTKSPHKDARSEGKSQKAVTFHDHIEQNTLKEN